MAVSPPGSHGRCGRFRSGNDVCGRDQRDIALSNWSYPLLHDPINPVVRDAHEVSFYLGGVGLFPGQQFVSRQSAEVEVGPTGCTTAF